MDNILKEILVSRICSGTIRIPLQDKVYFIHKPSLEQIYNAKEYYLEIFKEAELEGLYNEETLLQFMREKDLWDDESQSFFDKLPKEIEEFKLQLFQATFKSTERELIRKALKIAKDKFLEIIQKKTSYEYLTCAGSASMAVCRYLIGCGLKLNGKLVFGENFWEEESQLLDKIMMVYSRSRIDDTQYREIARTNPWSNIWSSRNTASCLFGCPATEYTDEQRNLTSWSTLYENIGQHPECPSDEILEDDDLLDGWLIYQRKQREQRMNAKAGDGLVTNEKIKNSQEIFIVAQTQKDANKIININDAHGKAIQKQRLDYVKRKGEVNELDMPDTKLRLQTETTQAISQSMKKG